MTLWSIGGDLAICGLRALWCTFQDPLTGNPRRTH